MQLLLALLLTTFAIYTEEASSNDNYKQDYRNEKAYEAILYDSYNEVMPYTDQLPEAVKNVLQNFGLTENDVQFYTATRMNRFVKKVGNKIILLRPNFFLYLSEEEQAAEIAVQLQRIQNNSNPEILSKNNAWNHLKSFEKFSLWTTIGIASILYRKELSALTQTVTPYIKKATQSKLALIIGSYLAALYAAKTAFIVKTHKDITQNEIAAVDKIGSENWIAIKEKQIHWGKRSCSWLMYQWYRLKGKLWLDYNPQTQLERYRATKQ
ncbi:MAG: hypothetical protein ACOYT8_02655 [Candidatus Dependentiae bacterium]